jgi:superfamily II DNA or RNA helicase
MDTTIFVSHGLRVTGLPVDRALRFLADNRFPNPKIEQLERLGKWTGNEPEEIVLGRMTEKGLLLPRGYFPRLVSELRKAEIRFRVEDRTVCPPMERIEERGALYPYQERALKDLLRYPTGVLVGVTGSGKTNVLLSAVARLETTALILVHTAELLRQTVERAREWLGIEPGVLGGGRERIRPVTVGTVQTLARRDLAELGKLFGAILIDECHHSPALTWAGILGRLPARYKYGFTATDWRKDGLGFLMWRLIGPKSATIARKTAEEAGKIVRPRVETVPTTFYHPAEDASDWGEVIGDLAEDNDRNDLIAGEVRRRLRENPAARALVLTDRVEHANRLTGLLAKWKPVLLTGEVPKREREARMERVRDGSRLTVGTVHVLGEGVDVPGWDLLFLASPFAGGPRTLQAVGRVARAAKGKTEALVVDFIDERVPLLMGAWRKRKRLYEADELGERRRDDETDPFLPPGGLQEERTRVDGYDGPPPGALAATGEFRASLEGFFETR